MLKSLIEKVDNVREQMNINQKMENSKREWRRNTECLSKWYFDKFMKWAALLKKEP